MATLLTITAAAEMKAHLVRTLGLTGSRFDNVGFDKRNSSRSSLFLHGVQVTDITNNTFVNSAKFVINHTVGEPKTKIKKNSFTKTASPAVNELNSDLENTAMISDNQGLKP